MQEKPLKLASLLTDNTITPVIGVSACLLGHHVRYDGGHKHQPLLEQWLSQYARLVHFCPESMAGLGTPRPAVQLIKTDNRYEARGVHDKSLNVTQQLLATSRKICETQANLWHGCILKARSPSCGHNNTVIYNDLGNPTETASGLFSQSLKNSQPLIPCATEETLSEPDSLHTFYLACCYYSLYAEGWREQWQQDKMNNLADLF